MKILVDADACPVKDLIIDLAIEVNCRVLIVSSMAHWSNQTKDALIEYITVDNLPEATDMKIVELANAEDIVITQDYGLAALLLGQDVKVLSPRGKLFTEENIDYLLDKRHRAAKLRKSGKRTKGPSKYSEVERQRFKKAFKKLIGLVEGE